MKIKYLLIIMSLISFSFVSICYGETNKEEDNKNIASIPVERKILSFDIDGIKFDMVECPAGNFTMGCTDEEFINDYFIKIINNEGHLRSHGFIYNEKPHQVMISKPFYIGRFEVTQSLYEHIMEENPSTFKGANKPVERVSYEDIAISKEPIIKKVKILKEGRPLNPLDYMNAPTRDEVVATGTVCFLERINKLLENQIPPGYKFDLPTEAQWEYACKAGISKNFVITDEVGWYDTNSDGTTHEVGQKKPNAWGIYDMHGNVLEWCRDWYSEYKKDSSNEIEIDPTGVDVGGYRVYRGGCFTRGSSFCRSSVRTPCIPRAKTEEAGFRLALVPVE